MTSDKDDKILKKWDKRMGKRVSSVREAKPNGKIRFSEH